MALGIALLALGAVGTFVLIGFLLNASSEGALGLWALGSVSPRLGAALAAATAAAATTLFLLGLASIRRTHRRRAEVGRLDRGALDAEQEARATLLAMRLEVLHREVAQMERRQDALGESRVPAGVPIYPSSLAEPDTHLVVVPDPD